MNKWLIVYRGINWTEAIYFAFAGHDPLVEVNHQVYKTYTNLINDSGLHLATMT